MKLKTFMIINAIPAIIVGILLVIIPSALVRLFGMSPDNGMDLDGQLYGSELILMGLVCWFARNITDYKAQKGIVAAFTVANLISLILTIIGETTHTFNAVGWVAVAAYLILTIVYGYYWLARPAEMAETRRMEQPS